MSDKNSLINTKERFIAPQIFEALKKQILDLTLPPLTAFSRNDLAKQFNASLTPVRDALIALEEEGLVNIYPQHITRVSAIDLDVARETQIFRRAIECEIIEIICGNASDVFFKAVENSIANSERLLKENNMQAFMAEDHAFHLHFYKEAKIEGLYHLLRRKSGHIERLRRLNLPVASKAQSIIAAHKSFVTALKNNDKQTAIAATRYHLQGTLQDAEALKLQYPEYFTS